MIDRATFTAGLGTIAIQLNKPAAEDTLNAYFAALEDETTPDEWVAFVKVAVKRWAWPFLPTVPELLDALREFRGETPLEVEAAAAYDRVLNSSGYSPEGGATWTWRSIEAKCGRAAADAFLEAGGHHAFATTWDESKRRERFLAAYVQTARAQPALRLLPPKEQPLLVAAEPVASDAVLVQRIAERAKVKAEPVKAVVVVATDDRLRMLREQAEAIMAEGVKA